MSKGINFTPFLPAESTLQPEGLLHTRGMAASGLPHCAIFPTAASRRSLDRVSVPVWLVTLSDQLGIVASGEPLPHLLANPIWAHLMARGPELPLFGLATLCGISYRFQ